MNPKFTLTKRHNVPVIEFTERVKVGDTVTILAQADEHWDNVHTNQELIAIHMQEAVDLGWPIIKLGDQLCLMQGKTDGRASKADLRPEHKTGNYIDAVVNGYAKFCEFAAPNIALIAEGNHEAAVRSRMETNVVERVAERWRVAGSSVHAGGIGGWLLVRLKITSTQRILVPIFYHHGHGGGGLSRGIQHVNKRALYLPDAQVIISGHVHEEYTMTLCRDRINLHTGRTFADEQIAVCTATYKDEYDPEGSSWHSLQGRPPKPIGASWLELSLRREFDDRLAPPRKGKEKQKLPRFYVTVNVRRAK